MRNKNLTRVLLYEWCLAHCSEYARTQGIAWYSALGLAIVFMGSMSIGYVAVYLMNRFMPWLLDLRLLLKERQ